MPPSNNTPGPWLYSSELGEIYYDDPEQILPLIATVNSANTSQEQADADGRLIAAAPSMLAALIGLVGNGFTNEELARRWSWSIETIEAARSAVTKAEEG